MNSAVSFLKRYRNPLGIFFVTIIIAILFYVLNILTPMYSDDHCYALSFATLERIQSVDQIPASQIVHYQTTNGRLPVHTLAQLFLLAGDTWFNYFNTFGFLALLYLIYFHCFGTFKNFSAGKLAVIAMVLFLSAPGFGQSYLWITGSANYLYGMLIILLAMVPYRRQIEAECHSKNWLLEGVYALGALLLCALAGWTNENTAVAMVAMVVAYLAVYCLKGMRLRLWQVTGLVGTLAGLVCMLSSPASAAKIAAGGEGGLIVWIKRAASITYSMFNYMHLLLLLFALLLGLWLYQNRQRFAPFRKENLLALAMPAATTMIYFLGFMAATYAMVAAEAVAPRTWSGPVVFAMIMVGNLSTLVKWDYVGLKLVKVPLMLALLAYFGSVYALAHYAVEQTNIQYHEREKIIAEAIENGERSVALPAISSGMPQYTSFKAIGDVMPDSSFWRNEAFALYYGFDEVYLLE